jgi:hypothetical protein
MRLSFLLLTVSATPALAQDIGRCSFPLDTTSASAPALRSLVGVYDLEWHVRAKRGVRRPPRGRLWLWPTAPTDSSLSHPDARPAANDTLVYPLFGTVVPPTVPLTLGDSLVHTIDPINPPVILLARRHADPPVLLFGTVATRQAGVIALDGAGIGVWLSHLSAHTIAGTFQSWGIAMEDSGYLCARRVR